MGRARERRALCGRVRRGRRGALPLSALVGFDVGTSSVKALALSPEGEVLARAERTYPRATPQPGWSEQDPDDWWRAAEAALADLRLDAEPVVVGFSGQMHGLVVLDEHDRVLRPAILWNDQRTAVECGEIERRVGVERLVALTGNRALTGFTAPKLLWLRTHEPETYERIRHVLLPKDYVRLRLEGERTTDTADASGTLLFDVANRRWSDELLDTLEVPRAWLPDVDESTAVGGAGDQAAGALGVGAVDPETFQPYLAGERTAHPDPNARAAYVGLSLRHDRGGLVRATLEGVAYGLRDSLELLRELGGDATVARVSGGGARSELWLRIVASVLGIPLERTAAEEGAAYGAALLGGVRAGIFADVHEAVATCVRVRERIEPNEAWRSAYEDGYARFRLLYPQLRPLAEE